MSISSISSSSAPLPFNYLDTSNNTQAAPAAPANNDSADSDTNDAAAQPPAPPPLPPGQGTRVNQLV